MVALRITARAGGYLVHVLFSQFVFFPINGPGRISENPGTFNIP